MRLVEAQLMRPPEALPPRNPTWESSPFSGLASMQVETIAYRFIRRGLNIPNIQGQKRHPNTKISPQNPMPESTFFRAFNPRNSLCSGCVFPSKCRKNANTKNFEGGRGGQKKKLCVRFLWVFFSLFKYVMLLLPKVFRDPETSESIWRILSQSVRLSKQKIA